MTETAPAGTVDPGVGDGAPVAEDPPRERDYVRGIVMVVGMLVLIVAATWLAFTLLGWGTCGCTVAPPTP